jgi:hypothetical protein
VSVTQEAVGEPGAIAPQTGPEAAAQANIEGRPAFDAGDTEAAEPTGRRASSLAIAAAVPAERINALLLQGSCALARNRLREAARCAVNAQTLAKELRDTRLLVQSALSKPVTRSWAGEPSDRRWTRTTMPSN